MYRLVYADSVVKDDIPSLPKTVREMVRRAVHERLCVDPIAFGKPLQYSFKGHRRLRVGDYRVIYRCDTAARVIYVVAIRHRKEVYED
ncbi:MAG: type II toxin-antitoxin system RelE family toxin [Holosporales bacterium]|jgi:mRNA interferase RelE/StbE